MSDRRPTPEELYKTNTVSDLIADANTAKDLGFPEDEQLFLEAAKFGYTAIRDRIFDRANQIALKEGPHWDALVAQQQAQDERAATWRDLQEAQAEANAEKKDSN